MGLGESNTDLQGCSQLRMMSVTAISYSTKIQKKQKNNVRPSKIEEPTTPYDQNSTGYTGNVDP